MNNKLSIQVGLEGLTNTLQGLQLLKKEMGNIRISNPIRTGLDESLKNSLTEISKIPQQLPNTKLGEIIKSPNFDQIQSSWQNVADNILTTQRVDQKYWDNYFKNTKNAVKVTDDYSARLKKAQVPFAGYAMSIMFFGMAVQRVFEGIAKNGVNSFRDISHSVEGTVTNSDMLEGSMKYLGYTIGSALEPIIGFLIPIIDAVSQWAEENPNLVATIITLGIALGGLMAVGGGLKLALDGFVTLKTLLGINFSIAAFSKAIGLAKTDLSSLGAMLTPGSKLMSLLGAGLAIVAFVRIFGSDKKPTTNDWLINLGLGAGSGFLIGGGGVAGALAGFLLVGLVMIAKESIRKSLEDIQKTREIMDKMLAGEAISISEAMKINFKGTAIPDYVLETTKKQNEEWLQKTLDNMGIKPQEELYVEQLQRSFQDKVSVPTPSNQFNIQSVNVYNTSNNDDFVNGLKTEAGVI